MNNMTLIKKFTILGMIFLLVVLVALGVLVSSVSKVNRDSEALSHKVIPTIHAGHELKLSVVQVQQWLTDISATRGMDGLNDGFDEAAANANRFRELVARLSELDPQNRPQYQALLPTFDDYYTVGQKMARAYVQQGPEGGNQMMGEFDGVASAISEQVEAMLQGITARSEALLDGQARNLAGMQTIVFGALLLLAALSALNFYVIYSAIRLLPLVVDELRRVAEGDLTGSKRIAKGNDEIGWLCDGLGKMKSQLKKLLGEVSATSQHLAAAAEEMTAVADQTRASIDRQQVDINQIATAMSEMSATSLEVAQNANLTSGSVQEANEEAHGGRSVVQASITGIRGLAENVNNAAEVIRKLEQDSEDIGSILDVIRSIADQTNLLALNAAIEAARAGEQGRGFAVVADEVRTLASRTQQSTQEIHAMIEQLQQGARNAVIAMQTGREQTEQSVEQIVQAGGRLDSITSAVDRITEMNLQIATAAEEQSKVAEEMAHNIADISRVSDETALGAQHTSSASQQLAQLSLQLRGLISHFKV